MTPILEVRELVKVYPKVKAVNGISFAIEAGCCFGLLGPNGAGKTTTIEMIEGIKTPTSGEILYRGQPRTRHFKQEAGIQFQSTALMDFITVEEILRLFASFYPRALPVDAVVEMCDLGEFKNQYATRLSGGQKQRLLLGLALIHDPEIVFLDEPTTGLDPQSRRRFWDLINDIKARGKTVVLTTHYMEEAERLCDRLVIIDHGRIIEQGAPQELLRRHFGHVRVCLDRLTLTPEVEALPEPVSVTAEGVEILSQSVEATLARLIAAGVPLDSLRVRNPTLEDLFIKLTGHQLRE
ncbi:MAG: ABC transporter ATP-binding protein [Pseudomonadales bacterium]|jgi:ABC-2 type transport system ATP-binding protein|nr:ABC transporter ATP-binding protein [Pseudomonadales bacterium]HMU90104.1 ABC transporter ATP-binding protein [Pseudomonadales bacterium]HMW14053.1 ABC transporter ATP-binding protein [Pseudomonadales bacterium]HMW82160.1 ABC transporter ATP-binding protein [Pseudomonadales bacterium]HMY96125.1 ABC transporter ATP-binding protein [Pseudomonadales bacterium]